MDAVDQDGEIFESYVTKTRDKAAALVFLKKGLKRHGRAEKIVTDGLPSYPAAMRQLGGQILYRPRLNRLVGKGNSRSPFPPRPGAPG